MSKSISTKDFNDTCKLVLVLQDIISQATAIGISNEVITECLAVALGGMLCEKHRVIVTNAASSTEEIVKAAEKIIVANNDTRIQPSNN